MPPLEHKYSDSPTEDPYGYDKTITTNNLRAVFESMTYGEGYYMKSNTSWHIHDPSNIFDRDGILTLFCTGKENVDGYKCGIESW